MDRKLAERLKRLSPKQQHELMRRLKKGETNKRTGIQYLDRGKPFRLSSVQEWIYFSDELEPGNSPYTMPLVLQFNKELNWTAVQRTLEFLCRRHEPLRTRFYSEEGIPYQEIHEPEKNLVDFVDLSDLEGRPEAILCKLNEIANTPLKIGEERLFQVFRVQVCTEESYLIFKWHHLIFDGWSISLFFKEFIGLYGKYVNGENSVSSIKQLQYCDYVGWQRSQQFEETLKESLSYWRETLRDVESLEIPTDFKRPSRLGFEGSRIPFSFDRETLKQIRKIEVDEGVTTQMVLLTVLGIVFHYYSNQSIFAIGIPVANRVEKGTEGMIGFFANTLPIIFRIDKNIGFDELLRQMKKVLFDALQHQQVPFERIVKELKVKRDLSRAPLIQHMMGYERIDTIEEELKELSGTKIETEIKRAKFEIEFSFFRNQDSLLGQIDYNTQLFRKDTIENIGDCFRRVLARVLTERRLHISEIIESNPKQCEDSRNKVCVEQEKEISISACIEKRVLETPEKIALICGKQHLSYRALNIQAENLVAELSANPEVWNGERVAVCMERGVELIVVLLALLKSNINYIPIDPSFPIERIEYILKDSQVTHCFVDVNSHELLSQRDIKLLDYEAFCGNREAVINQCARKSYDGNRIAYTLYTSGSTGRPKGIVISERSLSNLLCSIKQNPGMARSDRLLALTTVSFDISMLEIWLPLFCGASIILAGKEEVLDSDLLRKKVIVQNITVMQATPSHWSAIVEDERFRVERLKVLCGGEALSSSLAAEIINRNWELWNMYGPTETTIYSTLDKIEHAENISIGNEIDNTDVYVLDSYLRNVPDKTRGNLFIGGEGLAQGYWNRPRLTAEKFIPCPFRGSKGERMYYTGDVACFNSQGKLECLGRNDFQVKIRGFRIELEEIEKSIILHNGVNATAVVASEVGRDEKELVAFCVYEKPVKEEIVDDIMSFLSKRVPSYYIPSRIIELDALPLTVNGKTDRKTLVKIAKERGISKCAIRHSRNFWEQGVSEVWKDLFGYVEVGIDENFFDLGGNSIRLMRLKNCLRKQFGIDVSIDILFEKQTIVEQAKYVEECGRLEVPLVVESESGQATSQAQEFPLSEEQKAIWVAAQLKKDSSFNMGITFRIQGEFSYDIFRHNLLRVIEKHSSLKTVFECKDNGQVVQCINSNPVSYSEYVDLVSEGSLLDVRKTKAGQLLEAGARRVFSLEKGPLFFATLIRIDVDDYILGVVMHHIIGDARSNQILIQGILGAYQEDTLQKPSDEMVAYCHYVDWQKSRLDSSYRAKLNAYWKRRLKGVLPYRFDKLREQQVSNVHTGVVRAKLIPIKVTGFRNACKKHNLTAFNAYFSLYQIALGSLNSTRNWVTGTPVDNRQEQQFQETVGCFAKILPLRVGIEEQEQYFTWARKNQIEFMRDIQYGELPYSEIIKSHQRENGYMHDELVNNCFVFIETFLDKFEIEGALVSKYSEYTVAAKYPLVFNVYEDDGGLDISVDYDRQILEEKTVEELIGRFRELICLNWGSEDRTVANLFEYLEEQSANRAQKSVKDFRGRRKDLLKKKLSKRKYGFRNK